MFARQNTMVVIALLFITAQATAQDDANGKGEPKGSYSVLSWLTGGNLTDEEPPSQRRIATERPDFSFATTTVGKGRVVLETGYSYFYDRNQGETTRLNSYPEALLRIGLFTEWFEVQFGQSVLDVRRRAPDGTTERQSGATDLLVGFKFGMTSQEDWMPESSLLITLLMPTGSRSLTNDDVMPGAFYTYGWEVKKDKLELAGTTGGQRLLEGNGRYLTEMLQTAEVIVTLTPNLTGYVEYAAFLPLGADEAKNRHVVNSGLLYFPNDNVQFDIYGGIGLNRAAPDYFVGAGFSFRF